MTQLIGLSDFAHAVADLCEHSALYDRCGFPILAMALPPGSGQSTALAYLASQLSVHMAGAKSLEYKLNGDPEQMVNSFLDMHSRSATSNFFRGVVGWDLTTMDGSAAFNPCVRDFPLELQNLGGSACHLLFLPGENSPLKRHLEQKLPTLQWVPTKPYSPRELAQIGLIQLEQDGLHLPGREELELLLLQQVCAAKAVTPRDVRRLTRTLLPAARRSSRGYLLSPAELEKHAEKVV